MVLRVIYSYCTGFSPALFSTGTVWLGSNTEAKVGSSRVKVATRSSKFSTSLSVGKKKKKLGSLSSLYLT